MENESFERALEPQVIKRKRSSILKPAEKRVSRDSRTVSFNDRCIYKELHQDGTCDITNLFLRQDMDLTMMEVVEPIIDYHNQTSNSNMDISMDQVSMEQASLVSSNPNNSTLENNNETLAEENMIDENGQQPIPPSPTEKMSSSPSSQPTQQQQQQQQNHHHHSQHQQSVHQQSIHQQSIRRQSQNQPERHQINDSRHSDSSQMDISLISQFMSTMPKVNNIDLPSVNYDTSTIYEKKMSMASDMSGISSINSTLVAESADSSIAEVSQLKVESSFGDNTTIAAPRGDGTTLMDNCTLGRISDISSFNNMTMADQSANETFFGAFHDSNNISLQSRASGVDTLVHNIEALNECIQKVDQEVEECRRRLDDEIEELFKFYRHIVSKDNKYEFGIRIFGLRHSLWLIIKVNPDTYPNEKLNLRFAVNKRDRHLYPFPEYAEAVRRCTKQGSYGYLTRFVINAQKFRRFLRCVGYRKPNK